MDNHPSFQAGSRNNCHSSWSCGLIWREIPFSVWKGQGSIYARVILKSGSRSRCSSTQKTVLVHIGNSGFCKRAKELVAPNIRLKSDMFAMIANITCHGCTEAETMTSHYIQPLDECRHNCHQQANVTPSLRFQVLQIQHRMCHYEVLIGGASFWSNFSRDAGCIRKVLSNSPSRSSNSTCTEA